MKEFDQPTYMYNDSKYTALNLFQLNCVFKESQILNYILFIICVLYWFPAF
jgi:hypothetical protein